MGVERVIAYASQTLSRSQRNYCTTNRELLHFVAVVNFVKHFRHYLLGQEMFTVHTDHSSLRWLMNFKDPEGLIGRWLLSLQPFSYQIEHIKWVSHGNADGLSRKEPTLSRRRCARDACPECPTGTASNVHDTTMQVAQGKHEDMVSQVMPARFDDLDSEGMARPITVVEVIKLCTHRYRCPVVSHC